ncbi:guided entry of tail-anchored proteins factor 1-like [Teleopsis dalmanni]|uniref:guided entry of tail-anchored proteins factor 1-like n=1 Tax=Teleopsis dalmanni TaxID=139649 RepID=UPI0018CFD16E|nr:guided entry of tail-anchored proteins factor 1-like [Teleopsis dalmanni]XP_037949831.1 guided entry of tail-anchored proteins factor 1-like [Teleopsis dalmanni]
MALFLIIPFLCFLVSFSSEIVKLLQIPKILSKCNDSSELREKMQYARKELEDARNKEYSGEYARTIKIMRAERKLTDVKNDISQNIRSAQMSGTRVELIGGYALKGVLMVALIIISSWYRYEAVVKYNSKFNLSPLESILSFPTSVPFSISVPMWVFICKISCGHIASLVKSNIISTRK